METFILKIRSPEGKEFTVTSRHLEKFVLYADLTKLIKKYVAKNALNVKFQPMRLCYTKEDTNIGTTEFEVTLDDSSVQIGTISISHMQIENR